MKINVDFLSLPKVTKLVGNKSITFNFSKKTILDLINEISDKYGQEIKTFLLDESGKLDTSFKILLNKKQWIARDQLDCDLKEGDRVTIMMLVGGG